MKCNYCSGQCIKKGLQKNGLQKYQCRNCLKYQQKEYKYKRCKAQSIINMKEMNNEGVGISSISRLLGISKTTVMRKLEQESQKIKKPNYNEIQQSYEIDEICTYIQKNDPSHYVYVSYAINKKTKQVIDFVVGKRNMINLKKVVESVLRLNPRRVYTDNLNIYGSLIKEELHNSRRFRTNHIERKHLTIRTHLKRLSRKTICFSKSILMLEACLKIYFWG